VNPVAGSFPDETPGSEGLLERELVESDLVRETEYEAVLRDLSVKDVYVKESELNLALSEDRERATRDELGQVRDELGQVRERADELFADLERAEAVIAGLNAEIVRLQDEIAAIHATRSFRWAAAGASLADRVASPLRRKRGRTDDPAAN
jgi:septal ring factor EnvC (AmiA/AmiB activator)